MSPSQDDASKTSSVATQSVLSRVLGRGIGVRAGMAIAVVSIAAGLLLGTAVNYAQSRPSSFDLDLPGLVGVQQELVLDLESQVDELSESVQRLTDTELPTAVAQPPRALEGYAVIGPGVTVSLSDAPSDFDPDGRINVNDLVVHQQDVDAVMNAMWRGGAEAMGVQGVRITSTTPVRCIGNVILIGVRAFAPPYVIQAVGDVNGIVESVMRDPTVALYREAASMYQMGWDVRVESELLLPPAPAGRSATFAVVGENDTL